MSPSALQESTEPGMRQVNGNFFGVEGPLRLQLGGTGDGNERRRLPGFLNVDLRGSADTDVICDCGTLDRFDANSVGEIYASHILEHWPHAKTFDVLKEWNRVLAPGGKAYIAVPDFAACVDLYNRFGLTDFLRNLLYGDQSYDLAFHYTVFNFGSLANLCVKAGFSDVKRVKEFHFGLKDCSALIDTLGHVPILLNVVATK